MHVGFHIMELTVRSRRVRLHSWIRDIVSETSLSPKDLIYPVFVTHGKTEPIASMPDVLRLNIVDLVKQVQDAYELGIRAIMPFPYVTSDLKDDRASEAINPNNVICQAVRAVKALGLDIGMICDVALDPYTSHGHDGVLRGSDVDNDETVELLCQQAVLMAQAGADMIAPSDMMDGRIGAIRKALDAAGFPYTPIMSYSCKYSSALYGPFRDAIGSAGAIRGGSKATYQMDYRNFSEAFVEASLDIEEGADMLLIKPAMLYLDIIHRISSNCDRPVFAYQVSGEYSMLRSGVVDYRRGIMESLIAIKRAGARGIITYAALDVAHMLGK